MTAPAEALTALVNAAQPRKVPPAIAARGRELEAPRRDIALGLAGVVLALGLAVGGGFPRWLEDRQLEESSARLEQSPGWVLRPDGLDHLGDYLGIHRVRFEFTPHGQTAKVQSWCVTQVRSAKSGEPIMVQHLVARPEVARLEGSRRALAPTPFFFALLLLAAAGLFFVVRAIRRRRRADWLLVHGEMLQANLRDIELIKNSKAVLEKDSGSILDTVLRPDARPRIRQVERIEQGAVIGYVVTFTYAADAFHIYAKPLKDHRAAAVLEQYRAAKQPVWVVRHPNDRNQFMFVEPLFS